MTAAFFVNNRDRMIRAVSGGLVILTAYDSMQLSGDMAVPFQQEASFWWLTGIEEPGWKVVIDGSSGRVTLIRPIRSQVQELFDGGLSDEEVMATSGISEISSGDAFESLLRQLARKHTVVYGVYDKDHHDFVSNPAQRELHDVLMRVFPSVMDCGKSLSELRSIKSPEEIKAIERAAKLTCQAFEAVRSRLDSYCYEYEIDADFTQAFRQANARHAYEPIVACGENAVTLHYIRNRSKIAKNKLVLIDIGARLDGYCADVTRTYGIHPTKRQQAVHAAVQAAHDKIIAVLKPGLLVSEYLQSVDETMKDALQELGLLGDRGDSETYHRYFPHAVSHGLGVDVHDSLGSPRYLQAGMVLTVEPGIYIAEEGIGVRIEDDILITDAGHKNLTGALSTSL